MNKMYYTTYRILIYRKKKEHLNLLLTVEWLNRTVQFKAFLKKTKTTESKNTE